MKAEQMSVFLAALAFYAVLGTRAVLGAQPPTPSFSLSITAPESVIRTGAPIPLEATMTNVSDHDIYYALGVPGRVIKLEVRDSAGVPVPETQYGRKLHGTDPNRPPFSGSVFRVTVKPGQIAQQQSNLSKEYDISKLGKYTVQAHRRDAQTHETVKSNTITITVTQ